MLVYPGADGKDSGLSPSASDPVPESMTQQSHTSEREREKISPPLPYQHKLSLPTIFCQVLSEERRGEQEAC